MPITEGLNLQAILEDMASKMDKHAANVSESLASIQSEQKTQNEMLRVEIANVGGTIASVSNDLANVQSEIRDIKANEEGSKEERISLFSKLDELKKQVNDLAAQVAGHDDVVSACKAEQVDIVARIEANEMRVDDCQAAQENAEEELNRKGRNKEIILRGVQLNGGESVAELEEVIIKLGKIIAVALTSQDIEVIHAIKGKVNNSQKVKMLVVRFTTLKMRRSFFHFYMKKQAIFTTKALGFPFDERIYVTDNLTPKNAEIRKEAALMKKNKHIFNYSVHMGEVFVAMEEGQRQLRMSSVSELRDEVAKGNGAAMEADN